MQNVYFVHNLFCINIIIIIIICGYAIIRLHIMGILIVSLPVLFIV